MNLWKSFSGMVEVELTSASLEQSFDAIRQKNISVFSVVPVGDLTVRFLVYRKDYPFLQIMSDRLGYTLQIVARKGIYWKGYSLLNRPVLLLGILLMLFSAIILPRHVLFIQVEGNRQLPDKRIIDVAENCGIRFGASRKHIRSEKVKNDLLSSIPELQWAGVNTKGCVAVISVRERTVKERHLPEKIVSNIIADRDGFIISCTASKGNLICTQGQAVRKGELLISGYTDCGISIHATRAEGEVFAQTLRNLSVIAPKNWVLVADNGNKIQSISLLIGKKRINLWKDSGIWPVTCGRMYKEYFMTLPGGFSLPLALCLDVRLNREHLSAEYNCGHTPEEFARDYLRRQMVAGTILQEDITVADRPDYYMLQGNYICSEMIGRVQSEVIGEQHGKTS